MKFAHAAHLVALPILSFIQIYSCLAAADTKPTEVIFFGGYRASQKQMDCWEEGAKKNELFAKAYSFRGIPYPAGASSSADGAVSGARSSIRDVVARINNNPDKKFVIVGHSSGAAISNEVARQVKNSNQIELVDLDGFAPSRSLQAKVKSTCWYAKNESKRLLSRNAGSMKSSCQTSKSYSAPTCNTAWCLHFSLVNKSAPANLSGSTFISRGYEGCKTNLSFLTAPEKLKPSSAAPSTIIK